MFVMEKNEKAKNKEINKEAIAESIRKALEKEEKAKANEPEEPKPAEQPAPPGPADVSEHVEHEATQTSVEKAEAEPEEPKMTGQTEQAAPQEKSEQSKQPASAKKLKPPALPKLPKFPTLKDLKGRIKKMGRRQGILLVLVELILVLLLAVILSQHISINSGGSSSDSDFTDEISCADGELNVNTVSVSVPTDAGVSYSISYDWGKDDKDFPTVPKVAIASYRSDSGDLKYDISLYRESFTPAKKIPEGKKPSNWFDDWKTVNDENSKQEPKKSGDINGFLVSTVGNEPEGAYETTSFYFAVRTRDGVSVYVAEGLLYDKAAEKEFNKVMEDVIASIRTKKQAA